MIPPALSVSDTVLDAGLEAEGAAWELNEDARRKAGLAAAIAQWCRETVAGKTDRDLDTLSDDLHDDPDPRAALLTFLGVPQE